MGAPRVAIVGAGFGGLAAARALAGAPVDVAIVDRNNYHLFQPLLYQVATAALSPAQIATPIRSIFRRQRNVEVHMTEVRGVDVARKTLVLADGSLAYDMVVFATGSRPAYFGRDSWQRFAPGLKSIEDAIEIRRMILVAFERAEREPDPDMRRELLTFVCIGGGPTGVELAGAIAEIARATLAREYRHIDPQTARIILVESGPRILAAFSERLSAAAQRRLAAMGVEVRTKSPVQDLSRNGVVLGGERIAARSIIWAAGVSPTPVGAWLGLSTAGGGRVPVLPDLSVRDHPEIFVIGDAAFLEQDGRPLPGVAPVAKQQGIHVARVIRARVRSLPPPPPFRYRDKGSLATVGRSFAVVELPRVRASGFFAWVCWLAVHIVYLIGFRNRLIVLLEWAWAYVTFQRGARIISRERAAPDARETL